MTPIYYYAELLFNIRQVTVFAILPSVCNNTTKIELTADGRILCFRHENGKATIELPCPVVNSSNLTIPPIPTRELSFRLAAKFATPIESASDNEEPWPASKLTSETQIACQPCGCRLVTAVTVWKDLPSGGWADMMDFWHCHKPTAENGHDASAGSMKGYAASNDLGPAAGVGLVDVGHFLIAENDCTGVQVCL